MKICIAQIRPEKGNISANIQRHVRLIEAAVSSHADSIFFSELSLTGYEPELAEMLATTPEDERFDIFQQLSDSGNITIGVGVPTISDAGIRISMLVFQPGKQRQMYSKQQLHQDEFPYFVNGDRQLLLAVKNTVVAPAICYESLQSDHSEKAFNAGAQLYLTSVAKHQGGIEKAARHYPEVAKKYHMPVLMANCVGYCDNFESAGQSAAWTKDGTLIAQLNDHSEGILVFDTETETVAVAER